ncbi:hypothetical protein OAT84_02960 [Gammaproteobacteria bacterium]|nr:hypothetical protein [Gammaproteobacteria bacterium]
MAHFQVETGIEVYINDLPCLKSDYLQAKYIDSYNNTSFEVRVVDSYGVSLDTALASQGTSIGLTFQVQNHKIRAGFYEGPLLTEPWNSKVFYGFKFGKVYHIRDNLFMGFSASRLFGPDSLGKDLPRHQRTVLGISHNWYNEFHKTTWNKLRLQIFFSYREGLK